MNKYNEFHEYAFIYKHNKAFVIQDVCISFHYNIPGTLNPRAN